jgi:hypothetical protein
MSGTHKPVRVANASAGNEDCARKKGIAQYIWSRAPKESVEVRGRLRVRSILVQGFVASHEIDGRWKGGTTSAAIAPDPISSVSE